jgi:uncharacterized protein
VVLKTGIAIDAPVRRSLASRPRAPQPPARDRYDILSPLTFMLAGIARPLQTTLIGKAIRSSLRKSCVLRPVEIFLSRGDADLDGMRIAMISDLHLGFYFSDSEFMALAEEVSGWSPDLVCLVGDLVDDRIDQFNTLQPGLAALAAQHPVFAVPGNHEYAADVTLNRFRSVIEDCGAVDLMNRGVRISRGNGSLWLCGVDDLIAGQPDLEAAVKGMDEDEPALLLSHHPDVFCEAAHCGIDLTLSGHTHGGQVTWFGTPLLPKDDYSHFGYWKGLHMVDGSQLLVGKGAGVCVLPLRVSAPPEVLMIELRRSA